MSTPGPRFGLVSIFLGLGSLVSLVAGVLPLVSCLCTPLGLVSALAGVVLGVLAIVEGKKRGDADEKLRGVAGLCLSALPFLLAGAAVLYFSRSMAKDGVWPLPSAVHTVSPTDGGS